MPALNLASIDMHDHAVVVSRVVVHIIRHVAGVAERDAQMVIGTGRRCVLLSLLVEICICIGMRMRIITFPHATQARNSFDSKFRFMSLAMFAQPNNGACLWELTNV